jgi:hypothetical protein
MANKIEWAYPDLLGRFSVLQPKLFKTWKVLISLKIFFMHIKPYFNFQFSVNGLSVNRLSVNGLSVNRLSVNRPGPLKEKETLRKFKTYSK